MQKNSCVNTKNLLKFILCSAFGILMFLVPIPQGESFTTLLDFLKTGLKNLLAAGNTILSSYQYGSSLPSAGTKGRLFFKTVG